MNKKLLAMLLLLPVGFFAADRVMGLNTDGGGKEKKVKKTETVAQPQATPAEGMAAYGEGTEQQTAAVVDETGREATATEERRILLKEIKKLKTVYEEGGSEEYQEVNRLWSGNEQLSATTQKFLDKYVEQVLEEANPFGMNLERSFSRCPSGYNVVVIADENFEPTDEGFMIHNEGCWDRPIAKFRYDVAAKSVDVVLSEGTVSLKRFLELFEEA